MATRRVKILTSGSWWQPIKLSASFPTMAALGPQFNCIMTRLGADVAPIGVQLAAQYSEAGDQLNFIAYLQRVPGRPMNAASCSFSVDQMTGDGLWAQVSTDAIAGVKDATNRFIATVPAANIITDLCMGKTTLRVQAEILRLGKRYRQETFINHLGIAEAASYFRQKILRLEAFKKDE
jgi:hypothetical protein